jgi:hypothetical protein
MRCYSGRGHGDGRERDFVKDRLISESIEPVPGAFPDRDTPAGEPILPGRFVWRAAEFTIAEVLEAWKEYSPGSAAMPDRYLRKHWYRIRTTSGEEMSLYFERKARSKGRARRRWWLFSLHDPG